MRDSFFIRTCAKEKLRFYGRYCLMAIVLGAGGCQGENLFAKKQTDAKHNRVMKNK